ncbi:MAG: pilus assembly protein, partial [Chloroflexi bacterium]|nr:pilus assembly protein [Chloroflexota bacterium]
MKITFLKHRKTDRAQAMVEFMLALPVLLLLLYGIIEVGRLIFIFSSVANASRQAARYGSGAGEVNNIAYYQDCDGIRAAANGSAFIIIFDDINITYDRGLYPDGNQIPITGIDPDPSSDSCPVEHDVIRNGDRIIVQVSATYEPIISLIPIKPMRIVSASARSFLISIPIVGSALPTGFAAETATPSPVATFTFTPGIPNTPTNTYVPVLTNTPDPNNPPTFTSFPTFTFTPTQTPLPTYTPTV